jgi:hypothetical protein
MLAATQTPRDPSRPDTFLVSGEMGGTRQAGITPFPQKKGTFGMPEEQQNPPTRQAKRYLVVHVSAPVDEYDSPSADLYGTDVEESAQRLADRLHQAETERSGASGLAYVLDTRAPDPWYEDADAKNAELDQREAGWDD